MFILFPRFRLRISVFALPSMLLMLWLEGTAPFLILMISACAHELGHIFAIYGFGYRLRRLDILPMGALIVCPEGIPDRDELVIALCGPLASLCCAAAASIWFVLSHSAISLFAALINLVLALFNLMPIDKLDGGKALYCFLADKKGSEPAYRISRTASLFAKLAFAVTVAVFWVLTDFNWGVLLLSAVLIVQLF